MNGNATWYGMMALMVVVFVVALILPPDNKHRKPKHPKHKKAHA